MLVIKTHSSIVKLLAVSEISLQFHRSDDSDELKGLSNSKVVQSQKSEAFCRIRAAGVDLLAD